jgi:hypothetical protein
MKLNGRPHVTLRKHAAIPALCHTLHVVVVSSSQGNLSLCCNVFVLLVNSQYPKLSSQNNEQSTRSKPLANKFPVIIVLTYFLVP